MSCCAIPDLLDEIGQAVRLRGRAARRRRGAPPLLPARRCCASNADSIYSKPRRSSARLERTSALADSVIDAAYRIAIAEAPAAASASYRPRDQMMVIALGRLGMREFDLASDADLVFVIPDADAAEHVFWTGVAERMIQTLSAYTGEGVMFTVDTRLRPNGREGAWCRPKAPTRPTSRATPRPGKASLT